MRVTRWFVFLLLTTMVSLLCTPLFAQSSADLAAKADRLIKEGKYEEAVAEADKAIQTSADRSVQARAHMVKAAVYYKKGDLSQALGVFRTVTSSYKEVNDIAASAQLRIAYILYKNGDKVQAAEAFAKVADFNPTDKTIAADAGLRGVGLKFGLAAAGSITYPEAISAAEKLISDYADDKRIQNAARLILASSELGRDKPLDAIRQARLAISAFPALNYPGVPSGDFATFDLTTSYDLASKDDQTAWAEVYLGCANAVRKWDYLNVAMDFFNDVLKAHPNAKEAGAEAEFRKVEVLYKQAKYAEAASGFETFVKSHPTDAARLAWSYYEWGLCLQKVGKTEEADVKWSKVVSDFKDHKDQAGRARLALAELEGFYYNRKDKVGPVIEAIIDDYSDKPDLVIEGCRLLSKLYFALHEYDNAVTVARQTVQGYNGPRNPDWIPEYVSQAQYSIGESMLARKDYDAAAVELSKVVTSYPKSAEASKAHRDLATVFATRKDFVKALEHLDAALELNAKYPHIAVELQYQKGICQKAAGDKAAAKAEFQKVIDVYGETYWGGKAKQQLISL